MLMTSSSTIDKMFYDLLNPYRKKFSIIVVIVVVINSAVVSAVDDLSMSSQSDQTRNLTSQPSPSVSRPNRLRGSLQILVTNFKMPRNVCNNNNNNNTFDATNNINNNNHNRINKETGNCSFYFRFCLSYYLQTHDSTNCNLAVGYSKVFIDTRSVDNQIDLNTVPNKPIFESQNGEWERGKVVFLTSLNNSLFFEFYFDKPWQRNFSLLVEVYNKAERSSTISFLPQLSPPSTSPSSSSTSPFSSSASLSSLSSSSSPSSTASTSTPPPTDQLLYAHRTLRTDLNASLTWMTYADDDITFHVRAICSAKLKGPICSECQPTDNSESGHYRCQEVTEDRECLPGWSDPDNLCRTPICDPACVSGECISPNECSCLPGWKGERCETCVPTLPCHPVNGYCTHPGECLCKPGWGNGIIGCDLDMEYCTHNPGICLNGGTCVSSVPDIFCLCPANYEGEHCEKLKIINSCLSSPCLHSGTCVRMPNSSKYTCTCPARYTGGHCETEIPTNPCSSDDFQCLCSLNVTFCKYTTQVVTPLTVDRLSTTTTKTTTTISAVNPTTPSNATSTSPTTISRNETTTVNSTDDENNKLPRPPISDELRSILVISSVAIVSLILIVTTLVIACCCRRRRQQRRQQSKILNNFGANNQTISSRSTSSSFNNKTKNCQVVIKNDITNSRRNINLSTENEVLDKLTNKHQNIKNERRCNECLAQAIQVEKKAKEFSKHRLWKPSLDLNYTYQCSSCGLVDLTPNSIYQNSTAMKDLQTEADHPTKAKSVLVTIEPQLRSPKRKDATSIAKLSVLESSSGDFNYTSSISIDRDIMTADEDNIFNEYNDDRIRATCV